MKLHNIKAQNENSAHNTQHTNLFSWAHQNDRDTKMVFKCVTNDYLAHSNDHLAHYNLSFIREEMHSVWFHIAAIPNKQKFFLRHVRDHGQNANGWSEIKTDIDRFTLQEIEGVGHPAVFGVGEVENPTRNEGISSLGPGVAGVDVRRDGKGFLVELSHHDGVVEAGREDEPQAVLIGRHFEVSLGVVQQVR